MVDPRRGRQTPTKSVVLPYTETQEQEAIDLYNSTGRTAQEWQELLIYDILAINDDGLWVHTKYGYSVSRRNGKNEVVVIREMFGLSHSLQLHWRFRCAGSPENPGGRHYYGNAKRRSCQLRPGTNRCMNAENKNAECPLQDTQIL